MKHITLFLLWFFICSIPGISCTCIWPGVITDEQYDTYDLIVEGTVKRIEVGVQMQIIYLKVKHQYKGKEMNKVIAIASPADPSMCGLTVKEGERWLIYAYASGSSHVTDLCTRSKTLEKAAKDYKEEEIQNDLAFLEERIVRQRQVKLNAKQHQR